MLLPFYIDGLGLQVLFSFTEHAGFNGMMLGHPNAPYHLEITTHHSSDSNATQNVHAPSQDNLLVFYITDRAEWEAAVTRMRNAGFEPVKAFNPYWDAQGLTFEDPEGWRVVLQNAAWTA